MTYRQFTDMFANIVLKHHQLSSFSQGSIDELDIEKMDVLNFPLLHVSPLPASIDAQTLTFSFEVIIADMTEIDNIIDKSGAGVRSSSPETSSYSVTMNIMKDVIANFRQNIQQESYVETATELQLPVTAEPFRARFSNLLIGWSASFSVVCQNTNNLCDVPQYMNNGQ